MVNITLSNSFTGTTWARSGNTQVSKTIDVSLCPDAILLTEGWIQSYPEFIKILWSNSGKTRVKKKLDTLKDSLSRRYNNRGWIDPIKYLAKLYYTDWLSAEQILTRTSKLGLEYRDKSGINSLFNKTFGWTLRDPNEWSPITKKLLQSRPQVQLIGKHNDSLRDNAIEAFNEALMWILEEKPTTSAIQFSQEEYDNITGRWAKTNKALYLLECFHNIAFDDLRKVHEKTWISWKTITRVINTKINVTKTQLNLNEDLEVKPSTLRTRLKRKPKV